MLSRCTLVHYFAKSSSSCPKYVLSSFQRLPQVNGVTSRAFHCSPAVLRDFKPPRHDSMFSQNSRLENDTPYRMKRPPRQAMSAQESNAFNEMFSMIFDAAATQEHHSSISDTSIAPSGKDGIDDLIGKLRKYPKRLKWTTELDNILDRQKEIINLFTTDQELLEWAIDAVFGESQRYEAAARKAISEATSSGPKGELPMLQPPTYPHLVALLIQSFREKFGDPHLALSMFEYARNLSTASYVFGCSSQAYHQLIETRWSCFQDLRGVLEALEEMQVNGVQVSGQTRRLVEKLRRDIGDKHLWVEESEVGSEEVWNILAQIERIALGRDSREAKWDSWKAGDLRGEGQDDTGFNDWDSLLNESSDVGRGFGGKRSLDKERRPLYSALAGEREPFGERISAAGGELFHGEPAMDGETVRVHRNGRKFGLDGETVRVHRNGRKFGLKDE